MTPAKLQQQLKREIPDLRWLPEPVLPIGKVAIATANLEGHTITVSIHNDESYHFSFVMADGYEWAVWSDRREFEAAIATFRQHLEWFRQHIKTKPKALERGRR